MRHRTPPSSTRSPSSADEAPTTRRTAQLLPTVVLTKAVRAQVDRKVADAAMKASRAKRTPYRPKKMSPYRKQVRECSQGIVDRAVRAAGGNVSKAARNLGISRETIYEVTARRR